MALLRPPPEQLPEFHDDLILLTVTGDADFATGLQSAGITAARGAGLGEAMVASLAGPVTMAAAAGLATVRRSVRDKAMEVLSRFAEAGDILRATPILTGAGQVSAAVGAGVNALSVALAASLVPHAAGAAAALAGTSMVQVRNAAAREKLVKALADKYGVSAAAVPRRYLFARAKPRKVAGRSAHPATTARRPRPAGAPAIAMAAPPPGGGMWHLDRTHTLLARQAAGFVEPTTVKVAVLDTGIDEGHPLLQGRVARYVHDYPGLPVVSGPRDIIGHGTHVAGTIAAGLDPATGVTGMCRCELQAYKIFDDQAEFIDGFGFFAYTVNPLMYLRALTLCVDAGVEVLNMSIGGTAQPTAQEAQALNELTANGCTIVAAMGNWREQGSPIAYPAAHPGVVAVGATDLGDRVTSFSNRGPHISLCAPGKAIWSTMPTYEGQTGFFADTSADPAKEGRPIKRERDFDDEDGTSMASPQVAAAAAMYVARHPGVTPVDVRTALTASADRVAGMGGASFHPDYGHGRLNVEKLLT